MDVGTRQHKTAQRQNILPKYEQSNHHQGRSIARKDIYTCTKQTVKYGYGTVLNLIDLNTDSSYT